MGLVDDFDEWMSDDTGCGVYDQGNVIPYNVKTVNRQKLSLEYLDPDQNWRRSLTGVLNW